MNTDIIELARGYLGVGFITWEACNCWPCFYWVYDWMNKFVWGCRLPL